MNSNNVYYENNTWHHNTKTLHNGSILYGKKEIFNPRNKHNRHIKQFETKIARIKKTQNVHYTFTEYLEHWFDDIKN